MESEQTMFPVSAVVTCGLPGCGEMTNLKSCSKCKNQWYCGVSHQKDHWAAHKPICKKQSKPVVVEGPANRPSAPLADPFAHLAPNANAKTRYKISEMPDDLIPVYAVRKEITIRHGYNMMDKVTKGFFAAMKNDSYPIEENEGIFGVQMTPAEEVVDGTVRPSLGNLVYLTWLAIWKSKWTAKDEDRALRSEVVMMILAGKLPEWFQLEAMEFADSAAGKHNAYVHELLRRGVENVTYDTLLVKFCWGEISEADIAFLSKTAE